MPDYTLPIGPLHLITGASATGNLRSWGMFTITNDAIPQYTLAPPDVSSTVTAIIDQALDSSGSFIVTFTLQNPATTMQLSGTVTNNLQISGTATITTNGVAVSVPFQSWLLSIIVQIQMAHSKRGSLIIDVNQNLYYIDSPSNTSTNLGNVTGFLNLQTGVLQKYAFTVNSQPVNLPNGTDNYSYISGTFFNSSKGTGAIGPCTSSTRRQQGDDTWMPVVQNK